MKKAAALGILLALALVPQARAQTAGGDTSAQSPAPAAVEWPQFAKDLRRFDVISFGLFPFAYLVTSIGYDLTRFAGHGGDMAYAPWPIKGDAGWSSQDYGRVLIGAAAISLSVAAVDLVIVLAKRRRAARLEEARSRPETEITRTPLYTEPE